MAELAPSFVYLFLSLLFVIGIAWVVIRFMSGLYSQRMSSGEIRVLSSYALGARQQLYVVNFRNTDYFIGVTADKINVLDRVESTVKSGEGEQY